MGGGGEANVLVVTEVSRSKYRTTDGGSDIGLCLLWLAYLYIYIYISVDCGEILRFVVF